jgi:hypothetical protein
VEINPSKVPRLPEDGELQRRFDFILVFVDVCGRGVDCVARGIYHRADDDVKPTSEASHVSYRPRYQSAHNPLLEHELSCLRTSRTFQQGWSAPCETLAQSGNRKTVRATQLSVTSSKEY